MEKAGASVDEQWVRAQLDRENKTAKQLGEFIGVDQSSVSKMLKGGRRINLEEIPLIAHFINAPVDETARRLGLPIPRPAPVLVETGGYIDAHGILRQPEKDDDTTSYRGPHGLPEGTKAYPVRSAQSPTEFLDGWVLFARPSRQLEPGAVGRVALVTQETGTTMLAVLRPGEMWDEYSLLTLTGERTVSRVMRATPVIWIRP